MAKGRETIAQALSDEIDLEGAVKLVKAALDAETNYWADCPHCRKRIPVKGPDPVARVRALKDLADMGWGKQREEEVFDPATDPLNWSAAERAEAARRVELALAES
jgi:hypothetical protein